MKKCGKVLILASVFSAMSAFSAFAGWQQDANGWWYAYDNGGYAKSGIKQVEDGTYCFDENGYMQTGWQYVGWRWYYFDGDGRQALGWRQLDGKWYYLDPENGGAMHTYWLNLPDPVKKTKTNRYYLDENGVLQMGIFYLSDEINGSRYAYQTDETGALLRNKTIQNGDTEIRYDDNGIIRFRNEETKRQAEIDGTDEWQYLLSESELANISEEQQEDAYDAYYDEGDWYSYY